MKRVNQDKLFPLYLELLSSAAHHLGNFRATVRILAVSYYHYVMEIGWLYKTSDCNMCLTGLPAVYPETICSF